MIARFLRWFWIVTIGVAAAATWLATHLFADRIGPWAAGLAGIVAVFALHPATIAVNFVLSRIFGDPVPPAFRLSPWQAIKTYDAEIDASMRGVWFATPFLPHRAARRPAEGAALQSLPILFLHGYFCNRAVWLSFMRDAAARGYVCEAVTLPDPLAAIEAQLATVDAAIDALLTTANDAGIPATRVAIVGHSMGGLVARAAALECDASRIGPIVTLGAPHHGTHTARFGAMPSVVQMRRNGRWLAALGAREVAAAGASSVRPRLTSVFSYHDDIVYPQTTAVLEGAAHVAIGGCGHVALLYDRRVRTIVFDVLASSGVEPDVAPTQAASGGIDVAS